MPVLAKQFENVFPELQKQIDLVCKVVKEEEEAFLRTLGKGIVRLNEYFNNEALREFILDQPDEAILNIKENPLPFPKVIVGKVAFELYDTFGFPLDLTILMAKEEGWHVDEEGFNVEMLQQKTRSRAATALDTEDWVIVKEGGCKFVGYDSMEAKANVLKYRKVTAKGKESYQIVLDTTPFYAESGGQVGDTGTLVFPNEIIHIVDTKKENDLIIHFAEELPSNPEMEAIAKIDTSKRATVTVHHSATHLLHAALRSVLGTHVAQKGSLVNEEHLRFDFSHFAKVTDEEIAKIEAIVNEKIRENVPVVIKEMQKDEAVKLGAMALFGEKYGDVVRVVIMDPTYSIELCGGTHVGNTGQLGFFKLKHESAVAAGVRRIEAVCGKAAEDYINGHIHTLHSINTALKNPKDTLKAIEKLQEEKAQLEKHVESLEARQLVVLRNELLQKDQIINQITFVGEVVNVSSPDALKKLCFDLKHHLNDHVIVLCSNIDGKPFVAVGIADSVSAAKGLDAGKMIKEHIAPLIKGGGGGQKTLATAGGQDLSGLQAVIDKVKSLL
jgi:alanyl-tRNA synthetase